MGNLLCKRNCILGYETHLYLLKFIKKKFKSYAAHSLASIKAEELRRRYGKCLWHKHGVPSLDPSSLIKAECGATNASASSEEAGAWGPVWGLPTDQSISSKFNGIPYLKNEGSDSQGHASTKDIHRWWINSRIKKILDTEEVHTKRTMRCQHTLIGTTAVEKSTVFSTGKASPCPGELSTSLPHGPGACPLGFIQKKWKSCLHKDFYRHLSTVTHNRQELETTQMHSSRSVDFSMPQQWF